MAFNITQTPPTLPHNQVPFDSYRINENWLKVRYHNSRQRFHRLQLWISTFGLAQAHTKYLPEKKETLQKLETLPHPLSSLYILLVILKQETLVAQMPSTKHCHQQTTHEINPKTHDLFQPQIWLQQQKTFRKHTQFPIIYQFNFWYSTNIKKKSLSLAYQ